MSFLPSDTPEFVSKVEKRRRARMARIDAMPPEVRALVHQYGFHVVHTIMEAGVTKPAQIRNIVETILDEFSPTRGSGSAQGARGTRISDQR
jgi:hypothetical protein